MLKWMSAKEFTHKTCLCFAGQAGFLIRNRAGGLLAVDLCLSDAVEALEGHAGFHRQYPAPFFPGEIRPELVVATHAHYDHFDPDSVGKLLQAGGQLFCPPSCAELVENTIPKPDRVCWVRPGTVCCKQGFRLRFVSCDHGTGSPDAVGLVAETDGYRFLFVGDSCLRTDFCGEYLADGPIDYMIAPINGAYGNLNEVQCVLLAEQVAPRVLIPSHFGLFTAHGGDPELFRTVCEGRLPGQTVRQMAPGECLDI